MSNRAPFPCLLVLVDGNNRNELRMHSFAQGFLHIFYILLVGLDMFAYLCTRYNCHQVNGLDSNDFQQHLPLYHKGMCVGLGNDKNRAQCLYDTHQQGRAWPCGNHHCLLC